MHAFEVMGVFKVDFAVEHRYGEQVLAVNVGHVAVIDRARLCVGKPNNDLLDLLAIKMMLFHKSEIGLERRLHRLSGGYFLMLVSRIS